MTLSERLVEYVRACFTGLWIESHEHDDAISEIAQLCRSENWKLAVWDLAGGLRIPAAEGQSLEAGGSDPLSALQALPGLATADSSALLVLVNFHRFLGSAEIVQTLAQQITAGKQNRTFVVVLAPIVQIPVELEKLFVVLEHELPDRNQLREIAQAIATEDGELPAGEALEQVLDSAAGLTRYEAEGAFSLSLVREARIAATTVWELKSQLLKKSGLLSLHRGRESFGELGGLEALKSFCRRALNRPAGERSTARPRGVALVSPPGCGKSQFCKSLGNETGRPTLILDVGSLLGSLVGQTEERTRQALRIIDAMAPCVCMIDEVEKALAGVASSGQTDSGVTSRLFGAFLTWLNDHQSDVFVVVTCNDVSKLPPEFFRSERFDGLFFLDLPSPAEKQWIWQLYLQHFALDPAQPRPDDTAWTGAEIKSCCRLARLLDLPLTAAAQNMVLQRQMKMYRSKNASGRMRPGKPRLRTRANWSAELIGG